MGAAVFHGFLAGLFLHLGCFLFFASPRRRTLPDDDAPPPPHERRPRRKISPISSSPPPPPTPPSTSSPDNPNKSPLLSIRSYLGALFSPRAPNINNSSNSNKPASTAAAAAGGKDRWPSTTVILSSSPLHEGEPQQQPHHMISAETTPSTRRGSFSSRNEIFPCPACGEVLSKPQLLELHQATRHALSELRHGDSGANIVQIIFQSGWSKRAGNPPAVHAVLKIHNTPRTLARFDEYRELVRSRASSRRGGGGDHERCIADGNERLRFYCSTVQCSLGRPEDQVESSSSTAVCGGQFCSTCAIVRQGFTGKQVDLDGIATHATSWDAHLSLPEDLEQDFDFLKVRRTMLVCRVIAGRVARCGGAVGDEEEEEEGAVFDSVVPMRRSEAGPRCSWAEDEELLVFNPRAVLPCFIIIYTARMS